MWRLFRHFEKFIFIMHGLSCLQQSISNSVLQSISVNHKNWYKYHIVQKIHWFCPFITSWPFKRVAVVCFYVGPRRHFQISEGREGACCSRFCASCARVCALVPALQMVPGSPSAVPELRGTITAITNSSRARFPGKEERKRTFSAFCLVVARDGLEILPLVPQGARKALLKGAESPCPWPLTPSQRDFVDVPGTQPHQRCFQPV